MKKRFFKEGGIVGGQGSHDAEEQKPQSGPSWPEVEAASNVVISHAPDRQYDKLSMVARKLNDVDVTALITEGGISISIKSEEDYNKALAILEKRGLVMELGETTAVQFKQQMTYLENMTKSRRVDGNPAAGFRESQSGGGLVQIDKRLLEPGIDQTTISEIRRQAASGDFSRTAGRPWWLSHYSQEELEVAGLWNLRY